MFHQSEQLQLLVKQEICIEQEDTERKLIFQLLQSSDKKFIQIRLESEQDPFFLFLSRLTEQDFQKIQQEQNILLSFFEFPQKLVELLSLHAADQKVGNFGSKYFLRFKLPVLEILESNSFRTLKIISITLEKPSESQIRDHVLQYITNIKTRNHFLEEQASQMQVESAKNVEIQLADSGKKILELTKRVELTENENSSLIVNLKRCERELEKSTELVQKSQNELSTLKTLIKQIYSESKITGSAASTEQKLYQIKNQLAQFTIISEELKKLQEIQKKCSRLEKENRDQAKIFEFLQKENVPLPPLIKRAKSVAIPEIPIFECNNEDKADIPPLAGSNSSISKYPKSRHVSLTD